MGLGRYNSLYEHLVTDDDGNFVRDASGNYQYERYKMNDGSFWPRTTDNFWQDHNILTATFNIGDFWKMNASLHYTYGYGYYDEFRYNNKFSKFGLPVFVASDGTKYKRSDFVREKGLSQHTYGVVWNAQYARNGWDVIAGTAVQNFNGNHFGYLTYIGNQEAEAKYLAPGNYKYYDSDASKFDANLFVKALYHLNGNLDAFADAQYRRVGYKNDGYTDKFYEHEDGTYKNQLLNINETYNFFNPKGGLSYHNGAHRAFASVALSHREPERNNFTDNGSNPYPKPESLLDFELGYNFSGSAWSAGINAYYMDYTNQFVQSGEQSDIGEALTVNIKDSYRLGVEITAGVRLCNWLSLEANAALSRNRILDFDEYAEDWDNGVTVIHYDDSPIAFSPSAITNAFAHFSWKEFKATVHTQYVSRMYLDNTGCEARSLPSHFTTDLNFGWDKNFRTKVLGIKGMSLGLNLGNVFNRHYAASGWVYSAICESYGHPADNRYYQIGFIPAAGFTAMGSISLKF